MCNLQRSKQKWENLIIEHAVLKMKGLLNVFVGLRLLHVSQIIHTLVLLAGGS